MPSSYGVQLVGLSELTSALRKMDEQTLGAEFRAGLEEAATTAEQSARSIAPRLTGRLAGQLTHRLDPGGESGVPTWARVVSPAKRDGFNYGLYLEFGRRSPHRGWMLRGFQRAQGQVQAIMQRVARRIESRWPG